MGLLSGKKQENAGDAIKDMLITEIDVFGAIVGVAVTKFVVPFVYTKFFAKKQAEEVTEDAKGAEVETVEKGK